MPHGTRSVRAYRRCASTAAISLSASNEPASLRMSSRGIRYSNIEPPHESRQLVPAIDRCRPPEVEPMLDRCVAFGDREQACQAGFRGQ